ncbi:MAG TPA: anti-sigma factor, partial [Xanthobacteraceae bacterium]|nr:anti-sigma factor [Xanthobacteraceae bacterium]
MTERDAPVTEDELHAYVDGALPADRIAAVEAELVADPEARARVAAWRAQAELIRDRFASVGDEPVPERLRLETVTRRAGGLKRKLAIAAA